MNLVSSIADIIVQEYNPFETIQLDDPIPIQLLKDVHWSGRCSDSRL